MIKSVTDHVRIAEETKRLAEAIAKGKGLSRSGFYRLAIEEAVLKYRPKHVIEGPEFVAEIERCTLCELPADLCYCDGMDV